MKTNDTMKRIKVNLDKAQKALDVIQKDFVQVTEPNPEELAEIVKAIIGDTPLREFGAKAGLSASTLSRIINGKILKPMSAETLLNIVVSSDVDEARHVDLYRELARANGMMSRSEQQVLQRHMELRKQREELHGSVKQMISTVVLARLAERGVGIHSDEGIRSWNEWEGPVFRNQAKLTQLTVSYRNTVEIMNLARSVSARYPIPDICETRPVLRHGEEPRIIRAENDKARLAMICDQVQAWRQEGYHSIALIEKTAEQAKKLYKQIGQELDAHLLSETDSEYRGGVLILASIVKGMEFDCVGICDASAVNYPDDEFICRILYVMMTRPLHRLSIWHKGALTPLLA